jgi:hypothetical protein
MATPIGFDDTLVMAWFARLDLVPGLLSSDRQRFDQLTCGQLFYRSLGQSVAGRRRRSQPLAVRQR